MLWRLSSRPLLKESYRLHSHLTVKDHTMSLAHHYQSKSSANSSIHFNDSIYHVNNSLSLNTSGKYPPLSSSSIELDHPYSCSSRRVSQALRTLAEPQPPSPSSPPPLSSSNSISTSQQMMLIATPPTPPPSSTINNNEMDISQQETIRTTTTILYKSIINICSFSDDIIFSFASSVICYSINTSTTNIIIFNCSTIITSNNKTNTIIMWSCTISSTSSYTSSN